MEIDSILTEDEYINDKDLGPSVKRDSGLIIPQSNKRDVSVNDSKVTQKSANNTNNALKNNPQTDANGKKNPEKRSMASVQTNTLPLNAVILKALNDNRERIVDVLKYQKKLMGVFEDAIKKLTMKAQLPWSALVYNIVYDDSRGEIELSNVLEGDIYKPVNKTTAFSMSPVIYNLLLNVNDDNLKKGRTDFDINLNTVFTRFQSNFSDEKGDELLSTLYDNGVDLTTEMQMDSTWMPFIRELNKRYDAQSGYDYNEKLKNLLNIYNNIQNKGDKLTDSKNVYKNGMLVESENQQLIVSYNQLSTALMYIASGDSGFKIDVSDVDNLDEICNLLKTNCNDLCNDLIDVYENDYEQYIVMYVDIYRTRNVSKLIRNFNSSKLINQFFDVYQYRYMPTYGEDSPAIPLYAVFKLTDKEINMTSCYIFMRLAYGKLRALVG